MRNRNTLICPNIRFERSGSDSSATPVRASATIPGRSSFRRTATMARIAHTETMVAADQAICATVASSGARGAKTIAPNGG